MVKRNSQSNSKVRKVTIMKIFSMTLLMLVVLCETGQSARAQASNNCRVCRDQQQACMKNYAGPTCKTEYQMCMKSCGKK